MAIPGLNAFIVPFLEVLSDGQAHSRAEIRDRLAQFFGLTEEELQERSENGRRLVIQTRLALCDMHLVKAGFAKKEDHIRDSWGDCFRITATGQSQFQRHKDRIDIGYLQSFYRGHIYRGAASADTISDAELDLYELLEKLPRTWRVFHSVGWIGNRDSKASVGEIDFLIAHPKYGVLVLEAKGGEITVQREDYRQVWYSRSRSGVLKEIKDPCSQASRSKYQVSDYLQRNQYTKHFRFAIFSAVALPDSRVDFDLGMDCPPEIFIDIRHLNSPASLEKRLFEIFAYWQIHADASNREMDGESAIDALVQALVPSHKLSPRLADVFERERRVFDKLTEEQFRVLSLLRTQRQAAIVGGAGSGKTLMAMEKSTQLAADGMRVLFLVYNRFISESVHKTIGSDSIVVSTFHALVAKMQGFAGTYDRNLAQDEFVARAPDSLLDAIEILRRVKPNVLFDAVLIDEAQDFGDETLLVIPDLLKDPDGILYVFFDNNQRLYSKLSNVPISTPPFYLTANCRNTQRIHVAMSPYTAETESYCDGPQGRDVEIIPADSSKVVLRELQRILHRLVVEHGVPLAEVIILSPRAERTSFCKEGLALGNFKLTWDLQSASANFCKVASTFSFKGLEASVVILVELDKAPADLVKQLVYVGLSRARHHAIVIGELPRVFD